MKIIEPSVEIINEPNPLKRIEICGRVCYKSEDRITPDSARKFVAGIIKRGHTSVLEHARVIIPYDLYCEHTRDANKKGIKDTYGMCDRTSEYPICGCAIMNARDFIALGGTLDELAELKNADDYMTVRFICDRAIANELVRHRVFSFSQESTRYVNYKDGVDFIRPLPFEWATESHALAYGLWYDSCYQAERNYQRLIEEAECTPQEARAVLPLSTKTELVMTGTFHQWDEMLKLRLDKAAHPQMRYLMELLTQHELFTEDVTLRNTSRQTECRAANWRLK